MICKYDYCVDSYNNYQYLEYKIDNQPNMIINTGSISLDFINLIKVCIDNNIETLRSSPRVNNFVYTNDKVHQIPLDDTKEHFLIVENTILTIEDLKSFYQNNKDRHG